MEVRYFILVQELCQAKVSKYKAWRLIILAVLFASSWPTISGLCCFIWGCACSCYQLWRRTSVCNILENVTLALTCILSPLFKVVTRHEPAHHNQLIPLCWQPGSWPPVPPHVCSCNAACAGWKLPAWKTRSDSVHIYAHPHLLVQREALSVWHNFIKYCTMSYLLANVKFSEHCWLQTKLAHAAKSS